MAQHKLGSQTWLSRPKDIPVGSLIYVAVKAFTSVTATKLTPKFTGPFTVLATSNTSVTCEEMDIHGVNLKFNRERIKVLPPGATEYRDFSPEAMRAAQQEGLHKGFDNIPQGIPPQQPSTEIFPEHTGSSVTQ